MEFLKELWAFLRLRKKLWLAPIIVVMLIFGGLLILEQGSVVAPFIYTVFQEWLMYILGISAFYHDSAACILRDGEIIAAAQEEHEIKNKQLSLHKLKLQN